MENHKKCDVLVVGGGPAGIACSIAAARTGVHVILLERYGFLGGLASAGMVGTSCGLYLRDTNGKAQYVCSGFIREWAEELSKESFTKPLKVSEGLHVLPHDNWTLQRAAEKLIGKTHGIDLVLHGSLVSVDIEKKRIVGARAIVWNSEISFHPSCIVDCTGEASVLYMAGAKVQEERENQAAAVVFSIDNLDKSIHTLSVRLSVLRDVMRAVKDKRLSPACESVSFIPASGSEDMISLKVNIPCRNSLYWNKLTELELQAREIIDELTGFLFSSSTIFKSARLSRIPVQVGIRTGRRAYGKTILTEEDIINCKKFTDGVACGSWPMEEWGISRTPVMTYMPEREYYEIPIGCLIPDTLENVFVAGRCISASAKAIASARVIGTSLCTGWAAGKSAAFQANNIPLPLAIKELRQEQVTNENR